MEEGVKMLKKSKTLSLMITLLILLGMFLVHPITTKAAIGTSGFLKTNGTLIKDNYGNGQVVNLRGTNLGGWMLQEGWMSPLGVKDEWH